MLYEINLTDASGGIQEWEIDAREAAEAGLEPGWWSAHIAADHEEVVGTHLYFHAGRDECDRGARVSAIDPDLKEAIAKAEEAAILIVIERIEESDGFKGWATEAEEAGVTNSDFL